MELPPHPDTGDQVTDEAEATARSKATVVIVAIIAAVIAVVLILHLTGVVGPGVN